MSVGPEIMRTIIAIALLTCLSGCATADGPTDVLQLALIDIARKPYSLAFDDESEIPIGTNFHGFVAVKFTPKFEKKKLPSGEFITVDVSELTLKRGDKLITLVKGRRVPYAEHSVHMVDTTTGKEYGFRTGEEIEIGSRRLRLRDVNVKEQNCTLVDVKTGDQFTITRMAQHQPGHVRK